MHLVPHTVYGARCGVFHKCLRKITHARHLVPNTVYHIMSMTYVIPSIWHVLIWRRESGWCNVFDVVPPTKIVPSIGT